MSVCLGCHKGMGLDAVFDQICTACKDVLDATPAPTQLILENSAGSGGTQSRYAVVTGQPSRSSRGWR